MNDETRETGLPSEKLKEIDWTKPIRVVAEPSRIIPAGFVTEMLLRVVAVKTAYDTTTFYCLDEFGRELRFSRLEAGSRIIENVPEEPEYVPLDMGDRLTIDGQEYMVVKPGGYCSLINLNTGRARARCVKAEDGGRIDLSTFKAILGSRDCQWQEIYRTVRRCGS